VEPVWLEDVLAEIKTVQYGEYAVYAVDGDEGEPDNIMGFDH